MAALLDIDRVPEREYRDNQVQPARDDASHRIFHASALNAEKASVSA
jgi:hypothetical protein